VSSSPILRRIGIRRSAERRRTRKGRAIRGGRSNRLLTVFEKGVAAHWRGPLDCMRLRGLWGKALAADKRFIRITNPGHGTVENHLHSKGKAVPQRLKPSSLQSGYGRPEGRPLQHNTWFSSPWVSRRLMGTRLKPCPDTRHYRGEDRKLAFFLDFGSVRLL
jgi:hypothetical protein